MGYNTDFRGELKFTEELKASQLAFLKNVLGADVREHPEWKDEHGLTYVDLQFLDDFSGIQWDGGEKTYDMDKLIELIIRVMREQWPEFGLKGKLLAQGEDIEDRYEIHVDVNKVETKDVLIDGAIIECPHCGQKFEYTAPSV